MYTEKIDYVPDKEKLKKHQDWIIKLSDALDNYSEHGIKDFILEGKPAPMSDERKYIEFEHEAILKIDLSLSEDKRKQIFAKCSCTYPLEKLQHIKKAFSQTKNLALAHKMLQEQFEKDIEDVPYKDEMIDKKWGIAGILENDKIVITKIPKFPAQYFSTNDLDEKRYSYCHCGRVRKQIRQNNQSYSEEYCYCGAGYYKKIWEEITQQEVKIDVIETVLKGSTVCKFLINLN